MSRSRDQIGFSQRVRLEWLEHAANLVLAGSDRSGVIDALQEVLKDKLSVGAERGAADKVISILLKVWLIPLPQLEPLRADGLELLKRLPRTQHIAVHWGMVMAVYPFWSVVASHVGRLLKLQGTAAAAQVQRRIREQFGERETASRAARRVLRSYVDWQVLSETGTKGVYSQGLSLTIDDQQLVSWLVEASLHARSNGSAPLRDLIESPGLFPFRLRQIASDSLLAMSARVEILRHGLDDDLVMLRQQSGGKARSA